MREFESDLSGNFNCEYPAPTRESASRTVAWIAAVIATFWLVLAILSYVDQPTQRAGEWSVLRFTLSVGVVLPLVQSIASATSFRLATNLGICATVLQLVLIALLLAGKYLTHDLNMDMWLFLGPSLIVSVAAWTVGTKIET